MKTATGCGMIKSKGNRKTLILMFLLPLTYITYSLSRKVLPKPAEAIEKLGCFPTFLVARAS